MIIYTKTKDSPCFKLFIDWAVFEDEGNINKQIQDITLKLEEVSVNDVLNLTGWDSFDQGTVLQIIGLRDKWSATKIIRLKRDLEKFINPNQIFQKNPFVIKILADEYQKYDGMQQFQKIRLMELLKIRF